MAYLLATALYDTSLSRVCTQIQVHPLALEDGR